MGFDEWIADQALLETTTLEDAINWITQQTENSHQISGNSSTQSQPTSQGETIRFYLSQIDVYADISDLR